MSTLTFRDAVAAHFKAHPREWVSAYTLMDLGGKMAWRSRVSNCRTQLGMVIDNRIRRLDSGEAISEYRFVPSSLLDQMSA